MSITEMQAIKKEIKIDNKKEFITMFERCLNILRDSEGITGGKALKNISYLLILKLLEPRFGNEIKIDDYEFDFSYVSNDLDEIQNHKTKLLEIVRFTNLSKEKEENIFSNIVIPFLNSTFKKHDFIKVEFWTGMRLYFINFIK